MSPAFSLRTTIEPWGIEIERTFCLCKSVWLYFSARNFSWLLDHLSTTFNFQVNSCLPGCDYLTPVQNFSYSCPCGTWWLAHQRHTWVGKKTHMRILIPFISWMEEKNLRYQTNPFRESESDTTPFRKIIQEGLEVAL